jgi:hypothetical protein
MSQSSQLSKPSHGIVSDVPSDAVEHAKMVHAWAEAHPEWKKQHVEDKPKIRNRCGTCAAFHTPFCTWEYTNFEDEETRRALHVDADAYACSLFFPRVNFPRKRSPEKFEQRVENL